MEYIPAKSLLSGYSDGAQWFGANYNMNLYRGCCHGCIYCDSRSQCYGIEDFDRVRLKADTADILARELRGKRRRGVIGMGAMSDPYNPFEAGEKATRRALEIIDAYKFGAFICTKSNLVTRDIDLLARIARHSPVLICITITCASDDLSKIIEPNAPVSSLRFAAMRALAAAGICVCALVTPVLPFITDTEENLCGIVRQAAQCGAIGAFSMYGVTLRQNQRDYFFARLDERFPDLSRRYMRTFFNAYECASPDAAALMAAFNGECARSGIESGMAEIIARYRRGYDRAAEQLSFF